MKKLIVLSVIFALVAGSVFAEIGADVIGKATLVKSSSKEYQDDTKSDGTPVYLTDRNGTGFGIGRARISASGASEDGSVGGSVRFDAGGNGGGVSGWGWAWWKPAGTDIFKLQIGQNPDGEFGLDGVTRWGFYASANDAGVVNEGWAFGSSFFGGYGDAGLILSSSPAEGFAINIGIPLVDTTYGAENAAGKEFIFGNDYAYQNYKRFTLQVKYDIAGLGTAGITYQNSDFIHDVARDDKGVAVPKTIEGFTVKDPTTGNYIPYPLSQANNDNPNLWVYFGLTSIENLGIDVGIGYKFADDYIEETDKNAKGEFLTKETFTTNNPLAVGLGVNFNAGALGVKARIQGKFGGSYVYDYKHTADPTISGDKSDSKSYTFSDGYGLIIDVLPSYAVNDKLTALLSLGVAFTTGDEYVEKFNDKDEPVITANTRSLVNWHANPYISVNHGAGAFYAGIRLDSPSSYYSTFDKDKKETRNRIVNFSIPIGITIGF